MDKKNPIVYIVLTVYNGEKYFLEQLMSIYFQEYENWFLIIVDDGSTDSSSEVAKKFVNDYNLKDRVKIIHQENMGSCKATERGLIEVEKLGNNRDYVTYCDADDTRTRNKLGYLVEYMNNHKDCDLGFHDIAELDQFGEITNVSFIKNLQVANPYDNSILELSIQNHITVNLIFRFHFIKDILPIENQGAKDYRTALIFSLNGKKINYINKTLGYYRRGHPSIQNALKIAGRVKNCERDLDMFNLIKLRFPEEKFISYFVDYLKNRVTRYRNGYSTWHCRILILIHYPRIFFHIINNIIKNKIFYS